ncbi:MAG: acyl-CoA synthetase [Rhodospirillales bacterium]|nr:acyl-CoA synthetase [Rhodospirillales bacterium]
MNEGTTAREAYLAPNQANYAPLSPLSFLARTEAVFPDRLAAIDGMRRFTWRETAARCRRLASALGGLGVRPGETVALLAPNTAAALEAHFGVPMAGAVLNAINVRLDAPTITYILEHGEAKALLADREFGPLAAQALAALPAGRRPMLVDLDDPAHPAEPLPGALAYEALLARGDPAFPICLPKDEWGSISLNYTSGTTAKPKGVLYHHRGAYLNAIGNALVWGLSAGSVYLWTLPMFHCNGWCFPWTVTAFAGTHVCLRRVDAAAIYEAIAAHGVTHLCGAPVVMNMLLNAPAESMRDLGGRRVAMMTAGAAPPAAVIEGMERLGFDITHVYGLTETYGPAMVCDWHPEWNALPAPEQARLKARQGVPYHVQEGMIVADSATLAPVPCDGATMGEVFMRGNIVMRGYLKDPEATEKAFAGGWFHTGDLGVCHPDGYVELKDRAKDIIISGGENISTIEVEGVLYRHPAVLEAAVVARPDPQWGETPCAFVTLKEGQSATEGDIISFCRDNMAHFKAPKSVIFGPLPKTSTGKIQKFVLRARLKKASAGVVG